MHLDEAVDGGQRSGALGRSPLRISHVEQGLLPEQGAGSPCVDSFQGLDRPIPGAARQIRLRLCIQFLEVFPAGRVTVPGGSTAGQHERGHEARGGMPP
jgi:hypothetical protein